MAVYAALLHIVNHAVAKSSLFYVAGVITQEYQTKSIRKIHGIANVTPLLATLFVVGILAITGSPPFNIFISKFMIIRAAFEDHYPVLGGITLLLLTGIFAGMMRYCLKMSFGLAPGEVQRIKITPSAMAVMVLSLAVTVTAGVYLPPVVNNVLLRAAEIVLGG
jgi:hydrogenase-4 component F